MLKVGLTGGIGCGKSTAVDAFRVLGIPIVDADEIAKTLVTKGQDALTEIAKAFGDDFLLDNGELNRPLLKQTIFSDAGALTKLEAILHPRIKNEISNQILATKNKPYVVVDIPLLIEKKYQAMFDQIIVVDCSPQQQLQRVSKRDGLDPLEINKIMDKQASRESRNNIATHILDNTQDKVFLLSQIKHLHQMLLALS